MNSKYQILIFLIILIYSTINCKDLNVNYFDNSIFKYVRNKTGQLNTEIEIYPTIRTIKSTDKLTENYDFINQRGQFIINKNRNLKYNPILKFIYSIKDGQKEVYSTNSEFGSCYTGRRFTYTLGAWLPVVFSPDFKYNFSIPGPTGLIEILIENYKENKKIECLDLKDKNRNGSKKCTFTIEDIKMEYYFENKGSITMVPMKILLYQKIDNKWNSYLQFKFNKFEFILNPKQSNYIFKLPIGYGCQRLDELHNYYPKVITNYGEQFDLDFDVDFRHLELANKNLTNCKSCNCCGWPKEEQNYTVRLYNSNKMSVDLTNSTNIMNTIDEFNNKTIKLIYINDTVYRINLEDNKCLKYTFINSVNNHTINWFYLNDIFVNMPEIFYTNENYTYLGEYDNYTVFEKIFGDNNIFNRLNKSELVINENPIFKNKNLIVSKWTIVTHYYAKDSLNDKFKIPAKIEIQLSNFFKFYYYGKMIINIKSFKPNFDNYINDLSKCENLN